MEKKETKALIAEFQRAVNALSDLVRDWSENKANLVLTSDPKNSYLSALKKGVRTNYDYITWIQKSAALQRFSPPDYINKLDSADLNTVKSAIKLLGPFASESLSGLTDEKLQYKPVRDYTLEQMLEHAIITVWLQLGQLEK